MIEETLLRIAVALEKLASPAVITNVVNETGAASLVNSKAADAGTLHKPSAEAKAATKAAAAKKAADEAAAATKAAEETKADDGLGADEEEVTFEHARAALISVKQHPKLGAAVSKSIMAKFGAPGATDLKAVDYPAVVASCQEALAKAK